MKWATTLVLCTSPIFAQQIAPDGNNDPNEAIASERNSSLNEADSKFIAQELADGMAEVKFAELAVSKTANPEVKELAQTLAKEHAKANDELRELAESNSLNLTPEISKPSEKNLQKMEKLSGAEFDESYLDYVISNHNSSIEKCERSAKGESNAELQVWVAEMIPAMKAHVARAEAIQQADASASQENRSDETIAAETSDQSTSNQFGNNTEATVAQGNSLLDDNTAAADNTAKNKVDRNHDTQTPMDQSNSSSDIKTTAEIRRGITSDDNMSVNAQNVKIITDNGKVTLRGPVESAAEKSAIGEIADRVATAANVENQLEVK